MSDKKLENTLREMKALFKETAAIDTPEGKAAYKEFCAAIRTPILQEVKYRSVARELFAVEVLEPGAQAVYPVADDFELPVWVLPGLGYAAQNFVEGVGEDVYVPTFSINTAADWKLQYARESRVDIAARAARKAAAAIAEYEEECAWRVIVPAGTTNFAATGLLPARSAPVYEVDATAVGAGYLSKELINKMIVGFQRVDRELTDLWVSPEDAADIREWTDTDIDPVTRREIFQAAGMGRIWNIQLHVLPHLGGPGKFNINDSTAAYGIFQGDGSDEYNDYSMDNPNIVDSSGSVTTAGETQIWGFDMGAQDSLVMPIKQEFEVYDDPNLHRRQKQGFYGWQEQGFACLDPRMLGMGVIDRSL